MKPQTLVSFVSAALVSRAAAQDTGELGDAAVVSNNPAGAVYRAALPEKPFSPVAIDGNVQGSVTAVSAPNGEGVQFKIKLSNLPKEGGPFTYHLHVDPVPADGNCTKTLAHLDPYLRGEATPCNKEKPETCQVGDLSGKHGAITSDPFEVTYVDKYASLKEGLGSYFGNRSVVVHFSNKTRITCANFVAETNPDKGDKGDEGGVCTVIETAAPGTAAPPKPTQSRVAVTAGAATAGVSVFAGLAAFMFAL